MSDVLKIISTFESWFNDKFGWFFTNGNKQGSIPEKIRK